jgi:hypothetical protein
MTETLMQHLPDHSTDPVRHLVHMLFSMAKRAHYSCEDSFYSCPESAEGCSNDSVTACDCGANEHNARASAVYVELLRRLDSEDQK